MIKLSKDELLKVIAPAAMAACRKGGMPVLGCVHLHAEGGILTARGTDLTTDISAWTNCDGDLNVCVGAKHLLESLSVASGVKGKGRKTKNAPVALVSLEVQENGYVKIVGDASTLMVIGTKASDFPAVPLVCPQDQILYSVKTLANALSCVLPAVSTDQTRYHLNGILFHSDKLVATDGHRLTKVEDLPMVCDEKSKGFIVPRDGIVKILKLFKGNEGEFFPLGFTGEHLGFVLGNVTVAVKLIDAEFPPYEQVIPRDCENGFTVDRLAFLQALESSASMSSDKTYGVKIKMVDGKTTLYGDNPDLGQCTSPLACVPRSEFPVTIGVNARYLLEFLKEVEDERVTVQLEGELDPIKIEVGSKLGVVMPLRI